MYLSLITFLEFYLGVPEPVLGLTLTERQVERSGVQECVTFSPSLLVSQGAAGEGEPQPLSLLRVPASLPVSPGIVSRAQDSAALEVALQQVHHPGQLLPPGHGVLHLQPRQQPGLELVVTEVSRHNRQHGYCDEGNEGEAGQSYHLTRGRSEQ